MTSRLMFSFHQVKGFGLSFRLTDYTEEEVLWKIQQIVEDPEYRYHKTQL